jgi:hypothetical protein
MAITITFTKIEQGIKAVQDGRTYIMGAAGLFGYQRREDSRVIVLSYGPRDMASCIEFFWDETNIPAASAGELLETLQRDYLDGNVSGGGGSVDLSTVETNTANTATNTAAIENNTVDIETNTENTATATAAALAVLQNFETSGIPLRATAAPSPVARFCLNAGTEFVFDPATISPAAKFKLTSICAFLIDAGSLDMSSYGNGITLINGVKIYVRKDGVELDLMAGKPVFFNQQWAKHGWQTALANYGTGNESLQAIVHFETIFGAGMELSAAAGDRVIVRLQDNFTGLVEHSFKIAGLWRF